MQISQVFDQRAWRGAGDVDDCWVVASLQAANVTMPWLPLYGVKYFRDKAGNPDDPNRPDGGNIAQIVRGLTGCYPVLAGHVYPMKGGTWAGFVAMLTTGRPVSVAVHSKYLPASVRYGFDGFHQVCAVLQGGKAYMANPLKGVYAAWDELASIGAIQEAVLRYGVARAGTRSVYAVALPTEDEGIRLHPLFAQAATEAGQKIAGVLVEQARQQGYADAKVKAVAAVQAV